jgi:two-component system, OmpR family, response regulator
MEFDLGAFHFNPKLRELIIGDKKQTLSPKENELLRMLAEHKNDLLTPRKSPEENMGKRYLFQWPQYGCVHCQIA